MLIRGGDGLFISSIEQLTFLGFSTLISCLDQLLFYSIVMTRYGSCIVSQQGPLILRFKINSSNIDYWHPNTVSKVFPLKFDGIIGYSEGYFTFSSLCSPCGKGISKQYFLDTPLHFHILILSNLFFLISSNSVKTVISSLSSSSLVSVPLALPLILGKANTVRCIPVI